MHFLKNIPVCIIALTCLLVSTALQAKTTTEASERAEIGRQVISLFTQNRWDELDALADSFRSKLPTTSAGTPKLTIFYAAISSDSCQSNNISANTLEKQTDAWLAHNPDSLSAHLFKASIIGIKAGELRGCGYANTVDPSIWPQYKKLLKQQKHYLLQFKTLADKDPAWYVFMESNSTRLSDKAALEKWLREGSERFPGFQNLYLQAAEGYLPKWGGSPEDIEKLARFAVQKTEKQSGMLMYSYVWYNALLSQPELANLLVQNRIVSWTDMRKGWEARLERFNDPVWIRNGYLSTACLAGDKKTFAEQLEQLRGPVIESLWIKGITAYQCRQLMQ